MNPITAIGDIAKAILYPFRMMFVVGFCFIINYVTSPDHWWVQWVAFGMGIGLLMTWARAFRSLSRTALTAGIAYLMYRWLKHRKTSEMFKSSAQ